MKRKNKHVVKSRKKKNNLERSESEEEVIATHITCETCSMTYAKGRISDEIVHDKFHNEKNNGLVMKKYKNEMFLKWIISMPKIKKNDEGSAEKEIKDIVEGEIVLYHGNRATGYELKKLAEILDFINEEIPGLELHSSDIKNFKYLFYLNKKRRVIGILLCEVIQQYKKYDFSKDPPELLGQVEKPGLIGIKRIWTLKECRNREVASNLLIHLKKDLYYGMQELSKNNIAFSQPTQDGIALAKKFNHSNIINIYF